MERDALRALRTDSRQLTKLVNEVLDNPFVHVASLPARWSEAARFAWAGVAAQLARAAKLPYGAGPIGLAGATEATETAAKTLGERAHLLLLQIADSPGRIPYRSEHEVSERFRGLRRIRGIYRLRTDGEINQVTLAIHGGGDKPAARGPLNLGICELLLGAHQLLLHLLRFSQQLLHVQLATRVHIRSLDDDSLSPESLRPDGPQAPARAPRWHSVSRLVTGSWMPGPGAVPFGATGYLEDRPPGDARIVDLADDLATEFPLDQLHAR